MISILIPTYNHDISWLVRIIHRQLQKQQIVFEILCLDDHSNQPDIIQKNNTINSLSNTQYKVLEKNIGRSKIRNLLAKKATYNWLLFLDADVIPVDSTFIKKYLQNIKNNKAKVVYGGIQYQVDPPKKENILRWVYGKKREALSVEIRNKKKYLRFLTLNFMIHKDVFHTINFNENIPNARHEDTLFALDLEKKQIPLLHIENPVYHLGLETSSVFLEKSRASVAVLPVFLKKNLLTKKDTLLTKVFGYISMIKLQYLFGYIYKKYHLKMEGLLHRENPSLLLFDFYRLSYLCYLETKK